MQAQGLQQYLELGADPDKLVLGVPWYGYDYPCKGLAEGDDKNPVCPLKYVPFRTSPHTWAMD
jgi:di-N-acetylchitobiase